MIQSAYIAILHSRRAIGSPAFDTRTLILPAANRITETMAA